jgi:hypothetical protein
MSKLKLSDWASLAEIGASLVVVASLAYVGLEIKQNTKAVHAATYQGFVGNLTQVDLAVVTDANLDRIITTGESSPAELSAQEWSTFSRYSLARTGQLELAYVSHMDGTMSDIKWSGIEPFIQSILCLPGYRRFWNESYQSVFAPVFIDYVESNVLPLCSS